MAVCKHAIIDKGATVNIIDQNTNKQMSGVHLKKTKIKVFVNKAKQLVNSVGKFVNTIGTRKRITAATFYVLDTIPSGNLIS